MSASELMLTEEVAELLRVPVDTLRYWRSIDKGPRSGNFGRRVVYRRGDVESWVEAQFGRSSRGGQAAS